MVTRKTLAGLFAGLFLLVDISGWAGQEEGLLPDRAQTNTLAPRLRLASDEFQQSLTVAAICKHIEHDGDLTSRSYLPDVLARLDGAVHTPIRVLPHEIVIEIPLEGLAVRYFDPVYANVVTPYAEITSLSTTVIGPRLNRQVIRRLKAFAGPSEKAPFSSGAAYRMPSAAAADFRNSGLTDDEIGYLEAYTAAFFADGAHRAVFADNPDQVLASLADARRLSLALLPVPQRDGQTRAEWLRATFREYSKHHKKFINGMRREVRVKIFSAKLLAAGTRERALGDFLKGLAEEDPHAAGNGVLSGPDWDRDLTDQGIVLADVVDYSSGRGLDEGSVVYKIILRRNGQSVAVFLKGVGLGKKGVAGKGKRRAEFFEAFFYRAARIVGLNAISSDYYPERDDPTMVGFTLMQSIAGEGANTLFDIADGRFTIKDAYLPYRDRLIAEAARNAAFADLLHKGDRRLAQNKYPQHDANFMVDIGRLREGLDCLYAIDHGVLFNPDNRSVTTDLHNGASTEIGILLAFSVFSLSEPERARLIKLYRDAYLEQWRMILAARPLLERLAIDFFGRDAEESAVLGRAFGEDPERNLDEQMRALPYLQYIPTYDVYDTPATTVAVAYMPDASGRFMVDRSGGSTALLDGVVTDYRPTAPIPELLTGMRGRTVAYPAGNFMYNDWFAIYDGDRNEVFARAGEPVYERTYTMFVIWRNGSVGVGEVRFVRGASGRTTEVFVDGVRRTGEIRSAFYGQRLVHEGAVVPLECLCNEFDDIYQLYRLPQFVETRDGRTVYGAALGYDELYAKLPAPGAPVDRARLRETIGRGGLVEIDLTPFLTTRSLDDIKRYALAARGYREEPAGELAEGAYRIDGQTLTVRLIRSRYPHNAIGITRSGKTVFVSLIGDKKNDVGYRVDEVGKRIIDEMQSRGDPVEEVLLLANSRDVARYENGVLVPVLSSADPYPETTALVVFSRPAAPDDIASLAAELGRYTLPGSATTIGDALAAQIFDGATIPVFDRTRYTADSAAVQSDIVFAGQLENPSPLEEVIARRFPGDAAALAYLRENGPAATKTELLRRYWEECGVVAGYRPATLLDHASREWTIMRALTSRSTDYREALIIPAIDVGETARLYERYFGEEFAGLAGDRQAFGFMAHFLLLHDLGKFRAAPADHEDRGAALAARLFEKDYFGFSPARKALIAAAIGLHGRIEKMDDPETADLVREMIDSAAANGACTRAELVGIMRMMIVFRMAKRLQSEHSGFLYEINFRRLRDAYDAAKQMIDEAYAKKEARVAAGMRYIDANAASLGALVGERKADALLRVPVEVLESYDPAAGGLLAAFQAAPNGYVELFYLSGTGEASDALYERYGLRRKALPPDFRKSRETTVTLFAALKGETIDPMTVAMRLGDPAVTMRTTVLSPVGLQNDRAGLLRAMVVGLRTMEVARELAEKGVDLAADQSFKDRIQLDILERLKNVCDAADLARFDLAPDDIIALASGTPNAVVVSLRKLIRLLPIAPFDAGELRRLYEYAKRVLIAA